MPKTKLGKWSIGLIVVMPLLFFVGSSFANTLYESVPAGGTLFADIAGRPALAVTMLAGMASGIAAFITGLAAITIHKERTILVYAATIVGAALIVFLIGEFLSPH